MKFITSYFIGLISSLKNIKILAILYFFAIIFAFIVTSAFKSALETASGSSMALMDLLKAFDYSTYANFMHLFRNTISPLFKVAILFGVFYSIVSVFFSGGIISKLYGKSKKYSLSNFWGDSWTYLGRFFRLLIYVFIFQVIITLLVFFPVAAIFGSLKDSYQSEAVFFYIVLTGLIIYIFLLIISVLVSDYAKVMMVKDNAARPFRSMLKAFGFVFRHFFSVFGLNLLFILTVILLFIIYFFLSGKIGMTSGFTIFVMFLIQQIFIISRLYVKISVYAGEVNLFNKIG